MSQQQEVTINIFVDFHTKDENIVNGLLAHLSALKYRFNIKIWHHGMIRAGQRRDVLQAAALGEADIILLLMSTDYLNSPAYQTYEKEFARLSESKAAALIPIVAQSSMWQFSDIGRLGLQALPRDGSTIISSRNKSQTYTEIVQALIPVIQQKLEEKPQQQAKFEEELEEKIAQTQTQQDKTKENNTKNVVKEGKKASFQDYIRALIANNEVDEAFKVIDKVLKYSSDTKLKNFFSLFKSRYYRAENDMMMGRITSENMSVEHNNILSALLNSLDKIPEGIAQQGAEGAAVYLDSIIKVSEDKKADVIQNIQNKLNKSNTIKSDGNNTNFQDATINGPIHINMGGNSNSNKEEEKKKRKAEKKKEQVEKIKSFQVTIDVLKEQIQQGVDYHEDLKITYNNLNSRFSIFQKTQHSLKRKAQIQQLEVFEKEFGDLLQELTEEVIINKEEDIEDVLVSMETELKIAKYSDLHKEMQGIQNEYQTAKKNTHNRQDYLEELSKIKFFLDKLSKELNIRRSSTPTRGLEAKEEIEEKEKIENIALNEAKLIFIGNGGVGKTTLRENLIDKKYRLKKHDSTNTLEVIEWKMNVSDFDYLEELTNIENFTFNIWDFGGQGKYRAIQQFFCTPKALYIFVTTPKERNKNLSSDDYIGFEYWLSFVSALGFDKEKSKKSPVIYVLNKVDQKGSKAINEVDIENKFPNVKKFEKVSCKTGKGLTDLKQSIAECLNETDMINQIFSKKWIAVKNELISLKEQGENYIKYKEFIELFEKIVGLEENEKKELIGQTYIIKNENQKGNLIEHLNDITATFKCKNIRLDEFQKENNWEEKLAKRILIEEKANVLLNYLIYIGEILHYSNYAINHLLILDPNWGRKLASKALSSTLIINGFFSQSDVNKIWNDEEKKHAIPLLESYGMCYKIETKDEFAIPALFPDIEPEDFLNFDNEKDIVEHEFQFEPFIPADLLAQLTVKKFKKIWEQNRYWKHGVVFEYEKTLAIVTNHWQKNKLRIVIKGEKWEFALNDLNDAIEYLSSQLKQKLNLRQLKYEKHTFIDKKEVLVKKVTDNNNKEKDSHVIVNKENQEEELDFKSENEEIKEREKVRMLYISACPDDEEDTLISSELAAFQKGIEKSKQEVEQLPPKTQTLANDLFEILKDNINNNTYLHISVHGYIDYLAFINNKIEKTLAKINLFDIDSYFDILTIKPKIVLFSACNSYEFAKKTAQYVPFTIGTTGAIPIRAANLLTEYFYSIVINSGLSAIVFAFEYAVRCIERAKEELGKHSHAHLSKEIDAYLMPQLYINKKLVVQIYPNFLIDYTDKINQNKQIHII